MAISGQIYAYRMPSGSRVDGYAVRTAHYSQRKDGVWFVRYETRGTYGWEWCSWERCPGRHPLAVLTSKKARLPSTEV